jgi:hypothetical protein
MGKTKAALEKREYTAEEALDVAHWSRQVVSVAVGFVFGILGFTGLPSIVLYDDGAASVWLVGLLLCELCWC